MIYIKENTVKSNIETLKTYENSVSAKPDETQRLVLTIAIGSWPSFSQMHRIQFRCLENIQYMTTDNFYPGGRADVLIVDYDFIVFMFEEERAIGS